MKSPDRSEMCPNTGMCCAAAMSECCMAHRHGATRAGLLVHKQGLWAVGTGTQVEHPRASRCLESPGDVIPRRAGQHRDLLLTATPSLFGTPYFPATTQLQAQHEHGDAQGRPPAFLRACRIPGSSGCMGGRAGGPPNSCMLSAATARSSSEGRGGMGPPGRSRKAWPELHAKHLSSQPQRVRPCMWVCAGAGPL